MKRNFTLITLTNSGYRNYTLNLIKSLKKIGYKNDFKCYCLDDDSFDFFQSKDVDTYRVGTNEDLIKFEILGTDLFNKITLYKLSIIYQNLLEYDYVILTDGDVVFENNNFTEYLFSEINGFDMLVQDNYKDEILKHKNNGICAGFMFIRSNARTINMFKPSNVKKHDNGNDQEYINDVIDSVKYKKLPIKLFPNGCYYYDNFDKISPFLIHFNCMNGDGKRLMMKRHNKWYL